MRIYFLPLSFVIFCINPTLNAMQKERYKQPGPRILFLTRQFPHPTRQFIYNEIAGLRKKISDISIYSQEQAPTDAGTIQELQKSGLLSQIYYGTNQEPSYSDFDVVICQWGFLGQKFVKNSPHFSGKLIVRFRGDPQEGLLKDEYSDLFEKANAILPVGDLLAQKVVEWGAPQQKVTVHPSAINPSEFQYFEHAIRSKNCINILCIGRFIPKKGQRFLLDALKRLHEQRYFDRYSVQTTFVGDGPNKDILTGMAKQYGITDIVEFVGQKSPSEMKRFLKKAHIGVAPSITDTEKQDFEGGPINTVKEYAASGVLAIATGCAGGSFIIDKGTGLLMDEQQMCTTEASQQGVHMAELIRWAIENPEKRAPICRQAKTEVIKKYDVKQLSKKLATICHDTFP